MTMLPHPRGQNFFLATFYKLLLIFCLATTHYPLPTAHQLLLTTHCSLLTTRYSLLITHYSLLTAYNLLLTAHYLLPTTYQTVIEGMGELHLEIICERMKREFRVECVIGPPQVRWTATPTISSSTSSSILSSTSNTSRTSSNST